MAIGSIQHNTPKLNQNFRSLDSGLNSPHIYAMMNTIHAHFIHQSSSMFANEVDPEGNKWAALKPSTINWRAWLGYGPRPINTRTGGMRDYFVNAKADILGHSDGVISYAYPRRAWPDKQTRWKLEQASGLIRNGPARRVVGMSAGDAAFVLSTLRSGILEGTRIR